MSGELVLAKWGNSLSIRFPKKVLNQLGMKQDDRFEYEVKDGEIILKPSKKEKLLEKLFENYDSSQPYPCEIVDKGGAIGEELY
ncbi:AbrB/MazE/SpoVT family DNA-binding domain-containing protein [Limosilactobacillus mucosae]